MKAAIGIGVTVGSLLGGWLGSLFDGGNMLGGWGILLGGVGGLLGIYVGYRIGRDYIE